MLFLRSLINLYIVPIVGLFLYYKRNNTNIVLCIEVIIHYCIFITCNIPVTRILTFVIRNLFDINIEADSSYYTVTALISVYLLPYIYHVLKKIKEELSKEDD